MAKHVLYNASLLLNAVDLSDHNESVEFVVTINGQPAATMQDVEDYGMPGTRKVSPITCNMYQDFAASELYATLMPLWTARTVFNVAVKADAGAPAPTNPLFTVPVFISSFPVISGTRGDRHMSQIVLEPAGILVITTA